MEDLLNIKDLARTLMQAETLDWTEMDVFDLEDMENYLIEVPKEEIVYNLIHKILEIEKEI